MDFLIPEFHKNLKDNSLCRIENGHFYAGSYHIALEDALKAISEIEYKNTFNQWLEMRKSGLIELADIFLEEFEQEDRFAKLKQSYKNKAVVPFIGAGLSQPSGYSMWTPFLLKLCKLTSISETTLLKQLSNGEYEQAAEDLSKKLGTAFNEELENSFGVRREISGSVQLLPFFFDTPVFTTNFDNVLKKSFEQGKRSFEETIPGYSATEISKYLGSGERVLIKIHGTALSGNGRVLTKSEYEQHYEKDNIISKVIFAACSKTLLFMGCSLSTDRTILEMQKYANEMGHENCSRHYAFLKAPETQKSRNIKRQTLAEANIYPIWYSGGDHDQAIEALLYKLDEKQ